MGSVLLVFDYQPTPPGLNLSATVEVLSRDASGVELTADERDLFGNPGLALRLDYGREDQRTFRAARNLLRGWLLRLGATGIEESRSWSHHHLGTCRTGDDSATSVVDAQLRVHGTRNLYVASSAVFVTGGAAHPTLAIVALAHRLAEHLTA